MRLRFFSFDIRALGLSVRLRFWSLGVTDFGLTLGLIVCSM